MGMGSVLETTSNGWTALHLAAKFGFLNIVGQLDKMYPRLVCATDLRGRTAMHHATGTGGNLAVIELLNRAHPLLVHKTDQNGCTCLHHACDNGTYFEGLVFGNFGRRGSVVLHFVEFLVRAYPSLASVRDKTGQTALHYAARYERSTEITELLERVLQQVFLPHQFARLAGVQDNEQRTYRDYAQLTGLRRASGFRDFGRTS